MICLKHDNPAILARYVDICGSLTPTEIIPIGLSPHILDYFLRTGGTLKLDNKMLNHMNIESLRVIESHGGKTVHKIFSGPWYSYYVIVDGMICRKDCERLDWIHNNYPSVIPRRLNSYNGLTYDGREVAARYGIPHTVSVYRSVPRTLYREVYSCVMACFSIDKIKAYREAFPDIGPLEFVNCITKPNVIEWMKVDQLKYRPRGSHLLGREKNNRDMVLWRHKQGWFTPLNVWREHVEIDMIVACLGSRRPWRKMVR
jgi:hypothetical protein